MKKPRGAWYLLVPVIVGAIFAYGLLAASAPESKDAAFEDLALGASTVRVFASVDGRRIHCSDLEDASECLDGPADRSRTAMTLWLGNSQLHAVNQYQPGDETGAVRLFGLLAGDERELVVFSQPNASLQEHYLLFEYLIRRLPIDSLLLPLVFDDMRETGLRGSLAGVVRDSDVALSVAQSDIGRKLIDEATAAATPEDDFSGLRLTVQDKSERALNHWLDEHFDLWASRPDMRGGLYVALYRLRNRVFGINPSSVRRVLPGPYNDNQDALKALLQTAEAHGIEVIAYIAPLRSDFAPPYDLAQYDAFKSQVAEIVATHGARFLSLEGLVPNDLWGVKDSTTAGGQPEIDFMHFQAGGHRLLADALYRELTK